MPQQNSPFAPSYGRGQTVAPGPTSAVATLTVSASTLCLTNLGAYTVYVKLGETNTITASASDYPILPGSQVVVSKTREQMFVAHYATATSSLHMISGEGF